MDSSTGSIGKVLKEFMAENVCLGEMERRENVELVEELVRKRLIPKMRSAEPLFDAIFERIFYTGSYFENLKVAVTNEFDLNLILRLPFRLKQMASSYNQTPVAVPRRPTPRWQKRTGKTNNKLGNYLIVLDDELPGFAQFKLCQHLDMTLQSHPNLQVKYGRLSALFDDGRMLSAKKMNEWMQSVVDRALFALQGSGFDGLVRSMVRSRSGPANTLNIVTNHGKRIDIDLVPVVLLPIPVLNGIITCEHFYKIHPGNREGFLVPKLPLIGKDSYFRVSIPNAERSLMQNKNCAKTLIRIFKAIRDNENWSVTSYQIKTMFLWKFVEKPKPLDWREGQLVKLFAEMLEMFRDIMANRCVTHIFFPKFNLLSDMSPNEAEPVANRLDHYVKLVRENKPDELAKILTNRTPNRGARNF